MDLFKFLKEVKAALPVVANVECRVWLRVSDKQLIVSSEWTHVDKPSEPMLVFTTIPMEAYLKAKTIYWYRHSIINSVLDALRGSGMISEARVYAEV